MGSILKANVSFNIKKIAIIGAGPSGLAVAKYLVAEKAFETIHVFEQQADIGGVWNYTPNRAERVPVPQTTPDVPLDKPFWPEDGKAPIFSNPMYDQLITNIPKNLMQYSDQEFSSSSLLYPTRQDVQQYLIQYSTEIRHLIKFSCQVEGVSLVQTNGRQNWKLTAKSTITDEAACNEYDAIVVANGHYSVPFIPSVPGMAEFHAAYPDIVSHSKIYRSPETFANKKVVVVGNAASGLDIGTQISHICKPPLLNSVHEPSSLPFGKEGKEEVPAIAEYLVEDRAIRLENGRIEKYIDAIVYCTGYLYSYPFLKTLDQPIVKSGRRAIGLWQQLFSIKHPSLAFTALPQKIIPFPLSEGQGAAIAKVWSNKLSLPSKEEMLLWEKNRVEELGDGTAFHVLGCPKDAEYINFLHDWVMTGEGGGKAPPFWDHRACWVREIYTEIRKKFIETGSQAKSMEELGFEFEGSKREL